jgi:hypothetical protein
MEGYQWDSESGLVLRVHDKLEGMFAISGISAKCSISFLIRFYDENTAVVHILLELLARSYTNCEGVATLPNSTSSNPSNAFNALSR